MTRLQLTIPTQDDAHPGIKFKPRELRQWLDNLPHLDVQRTAQLTSEQLRLLNRQVLAPATRLEILNDFLATYQRLLDTLPINPADTQALQAQLKRLCQDMGFGYKIAVHELVNKRSRFMEPRHLGPALLGSIYTLGLQLLHYYVHYQRAPRALWGECLALYRYARQKGHETFRSGLPGAGEIQLDDTFRLIALLRLADPYRLPAGMVEPLSLYLRARIAMSRIQTEPGTDTATSFELLDSAQSGNHPAHEPPLFIDLAALTEQIAMDIKRLKLHHQSQSLGLPAEVPALGFGHTLHQLLQHWQNHPTRKLDRAQAHTQIELIQGLESAYCVINNGRAFDPALFLTPGQEDVIDLGVRPSPEVTASHNTPNPFSCSSINRSNGGLAIGYRGARQPHPRVGQVVGLRRPTAKSSAGWVIAVCRWLVEPESGSGFDLGLQYLAREPRAVVIRVVAACGLGADHQPAIAATQKRGQQRVHTLITRRMEIQPGALLALHEQGGQAKVRCIEILESGPGFERFIYEPV